MATKHIATPSAARKGRRAPTKPDPIFAAIERHADAVKAHGRAVDVMAKFEESTPSRLQDGPVFILNSNYKFDAPGHIKQHVDRLIPDFANRFGPKTKRQILRLMGPAKRELYGMQRKYWEAYHKERRKCGIKAADDALMNASNVEFQALAKMVRTKPTTRDGLLALLKYLKPIYDADGLRSWQNWPSDGFDLFGSLAASVAALTPEGDR